ncbi:hypothetical protein ACFRMN_27600 [Streptomyces sp. NPDC056835]|uniref:hypothetical protein n=1 Tax=Streptomyces sp. NPDC056835 TaxID=3345956 RepID=UPI003681BD81
MNTASPGSGTTHRAPAHADEADRSQVIAGIGRPGVPAVHKTGRHEGDTLFIAMERIDGAVKANCSPP